MVNRGNDIGCYSGQGHLPRNLLVINYLLNLLLPWATPVIGLSLIKELS